MNPADPDTILTAMVDTQDQTKRCEECVTLFTAVGIKWAYQDRVLHFVPRLGGMHMLMSFGGCIRNLMANSGLKEVAWRRRSRETKFPQNVRALHIVAEKVLRPVLGQSGCNSDLLEHLQTLSKQSRTTRL